MKNIENNQFTQSNENESRSFFRTMLDEKDLLDEIFTLNDTSGLLHIIEMEFLVEMMEKTNPKEQDSIEKIMRKIDFQNGDMMHFMNHLAKSYITENFS
jgi:hypothetical protein